MGLLCVLVAAASTAAAPEAAKCRCVPPDPCWSAVPFDKLNASVAGRLEKSVDELKICQLYKAGC